MANAVVTLRSSLVGDIVVDRESGVIRNISVVTMGTTLTSGNGVQPFDIDVVTLGQVAAAINQSNVGIKSRLTHPEIEGKDDLPCRLGYVRNARVVGNAVRADMVFHNSASNEALLLMSIAEQDPSSCGLSIVDEDATLEPSTSASTGIVLRVSTIDAVDWVGQPAGNPAGMLSSIRKTMLQKGNEMYNEKQMELLRSFGMSADADEAAVAAFVEGLTDEQKAQLEAAAETTPVATAEDEEGAGGDLEKQFADSLSEEQVAMLEEIESKKGQAVAASAKPKGKDGVALSQADIDAAIKRDRQVQRDREKKIRGIALKAGRDEKWIQEQIEGEATVGEIALSAINSINRSPGDMPTTSVKVGADLNRDSLNQAVQDAILLKAGTRTFVKFDEATNGVCLSANNRPEVRPPHERANEFRGHTPVEMGRRYLVALGYHAADKMNKSQLATLLMSRTQLQAVLPGVYMAHSTGDFPYLLADSMGKVLRGEYALAPHTWDMWCRRTTAPDFKDIKVLQLSEAADLAVIPEGDEYTYGGLTESRETYALRTQGKGLKFTRQMLINDDLSAFDRVPRLMGRAAARAVESEGISILTANAALADSVALFATAHANLSTGTLSVASLGAARALLRKQTALGSDDPLELTPKFLLVPETISTTAQQLVSSTVDPAKNNATPNPFANQLEVVPSARLDSDSTAQWYLLADPAEIDTVEAAFLEGEETPVVEEEDEFDTDCRKIKVRHTFRFKAIDYRGMVRSSGS